MCMVIATYRLEAKRSCNLSMREMHGKCISPFLIHIIGSLLDQHLGASSKYPLHIISDMADTLDEWSRRNQHALVGHVLAHTYSLTANRQRNVTSEAKLDPSGLSTDMGGHTRLHFTLVYKESSVDIKFEDSWVKFNEDIYMCAAC